MWKLIDWLSAFLCRHGFHEWGDWRANTWHGRMFWDWSRECERCGATENMSQGENPPGMTHPGTTY